MRGDDERLRSAQVLAWMRERVSSATKRPWQSQVATHFARAAALGRGADARGGSRIGRATLILPPSTPGSLGDEAMMAVCFERLAEEQGARVGVVDFTSARAVWPGAPEGLAHVSASGYFGAGHLRSLPRLVRALRGYDRLWCLGADVLDGHYAPAGSVRRITLAHVAAELGLEARDLLSPKARERWEERRRRHSETGRASEGGHDYGWPDEPEGHDTVGALARDVRGTLAGACSTSGLAFKRHGRVGDSPIIGHGLYVEPGIGAAVATGLGELAMGVCATFLAVESLRRGDSPSDAAAVPLRRIADQFELHPQHQLAVLVLVPDGSWSAAALRPGYVTSVRSEDEEGTREPDTVLFP